MKFQFATCDRKRALKFLQKFYPSRDLHDTPDSAGPLLDLVEKDVIRIPDPDFHPDGTVCASKAFDSVGEAAVLEVFASFNAATRAASATPPAEVAGSVEDAG